MATVGRRRETPPQNPTIKTIKPSNMLGYSLIDLRRNFWLSSSKDCDRSRSRRSRTRSRRSRSRETATATGDRNRRTTEWTECGTIQNRGRLHKMMMTASAVPSTFDLDLGGSTFPLSSFVFFHVCYVKSWRRRDVNEGPDHQNINGEKEIFESKGKQVSKNFYSWLISRSHLHSVWIAKT